MRQRGRNGMKSCESWQEFERYVQQLLRMSGYSVEPGRLVGSKRVDAIAEHTVLGKLRRIAVECKSLAHAMSRDEVSKVLSDYRGLVKSSQVHSILLVTASGLTDAAGALVAENRELYHLTLDDLRNSIMDFEVYLANLKAQYTEFGVDQYYVPTNAHLASSRIDLESFIMEWLQQDESSPLALLGGYGSGKTTFLQHLADRLVDLYRSGESSRIPIYIPLSELCSEQRLEGLLGRHFTSLHVVPGYSFGAFKEWNSAGRFVLLLDGFDEMKHSMRPGEFRYTFEQLLRLAVPQTKAVISGRPNAFLSKEERDEFLHGIYTHRGTRVEVADRPRFTEIEVSPFDEDDIRAFIRKYRSYLAATPSTSHLGIPTEAEFLENRNIAELARRPLQLRMLFDVLPEFSGSLDTLEETALYTVFVSMVLDREQSKHSRRGFPKPVRERFHECLAYYMWDFGEPVLALDEVPVACIPTDTTGMHPGEAMRDLMSGSLLEERYPARVRFPHRSMQEFFVAQFLLAFFRKEDYALSLLPELRNSLDMQYIDSSLSPEVVDFLVAGAGSKERQGAMRLLRECKKRLQSNSLRLWFDASASKSELIALASKGSDLALALLAVGRSRGWEWTGTERADLLNAIGNHLASYAARSRGRCYGAFLWSWYLLAQEPEDEYRALLSQLVRWILQATEKKQAVISGQEVSGYLRPHHIDRLIRVMCDLQGATLTMPNLEDTDVVVSVERALELLRTLSVSQLVCLDLPSVEKSRLKIAASDEILRLVCERFDHDLLEGPSARSSGHGV